jgi:hypothetical protein
MPQLARDTDEVYRRRATRRLEANLLLKAWPPRCQRARRHGDGSRRFNHPLRQLSAALGFVEALLTLPLA